MIPAAAERELRAIAGLARGLAKSQGKKQIGLCIEVLADRLDNMADEYGELSWRKRVEAQHAAR